MDNMEDVDVDELLAMDNGEFDQDEDLEEDDDWNDAALVSNLKSILEISFLKFYFTLGVSKATFGG